jgi:hypothetical protein
MTEIIATYKNTKMRLTLIIILLAGASLAYANTQAELNELGQRQRQAASGCKNQ